MNLIFRPLGYLHVVPPQPHICRPVTSVRPFVPDHLHHMHVNATVWEPWQGGRNLLHDHHLSHPMLVYKVFLEPAHCVGTLWAPLYRNRNNLYLFKKMIVSFVNFFLCLVNKSSWTTYFLSHSFWKMIVLRWVCWWFVFINSFGENYPYRFKILNDLFLK